MRAAHRRAFSFTIFPTIQTPSGRESKLSRHTIKTIHPELHLCWVGYDRDPDSYYIYVARHLRRDKTGQVIGGQNGHVVYYAGLIDGRIESVEQVAEMVAHYAVLAPEMYQVLRNDRLAERGGESKDLTARGNSYVRSS